MKNPDGLTGRIYATLCKEYFAIGVTRVKSLHAWSVFGLVTITAMSMVFIAIGSSSLELGQAAVIISGSKYSSASTLPPFIVCAAPTDLTNAATAFTINKPTITSIVYQCKSVCSAQDGSRCTYITEDVLGNPLTTIAYVTDSMGGQLRWNTPSQIKAGVLQHDGGLGSSDFASDRSPDVRSLWVQFDASGGVRQIEPKWQTEVMGWFSRKNSKGTTLPELTKRPAAVMEWARTNLIPTQNKFGTVGCSGGSIATFGPVYWHGLDKIVDYQYFSGALPAAFDIPATCSQTQSLVGVCENNPAQACTIQSNCGGNYKCAFPQPIGRFGSTSGNPLGETVKVLIDYITATPGACLLGTITPAMFASSFKYVPGNLSYSHPVDFDNGIGGDYQWWKKNNSGLPYFMTDTNLGVTYNTESIYNLIQTSKYKTRTIIPGTHCESQWNTAYLPGVLNKVSIGLGLSSLTSSSSSVSSRSTTLISPSFSLVPTRP